MDKLTAVITVICSSSRVPGFILISCIIFYDYQVWIFLQIHSMQCSTVCICGSNVNCERKSVYIVSKNNWNY